MALHEIALSSHRERRLRKKLMHSFWRVIAILPDEPYVRWKYFSMSGRFPDLRNPKRFTEKVQVRKLYSRHPLYPVLVDKYAAKAFIAERAGSEYVIETYWVGRNLEEIEWDQIPLPAVVKPTHGSGAGVFLHDRSDIDKLLRNNPAPHWMAQRHDRINREWAYGQLVPQVIIERMLGENGSAPDDYRFFVLSGKVALIELRLRRDGIGYECYYTSDWKRMALSSNYYPSYPHEPSRPAQLDEMLEVARRVAGDIDFVRVDLYLEGGKVYVGELTLYPGGGFHGSVPDQIDESLGNLWTLKTWPPKEGRSL
jgi:hypothetical protein